MTISAAASNSISALLADGHLAQAVALASAAVKARPTSALDRILLAELLALQGANERADAQLQLAGDQAPAELIAISQLRWLLRGAEARRAWYETGALPGFLGEPTERQKHVMRLALAVRNNEPAEAAELRTALEDGIMTQAAVNGGATADLRDICDLSQHGFEVLTLDGRYLWIAPEQISQVKFSPARRPHDLLWRRGETLLRDGRQTTFYFVAQYYDADANDLQRLAQATEWGEAIGGVVFGRGQKILLSGDDGREFLDIEHIVIHEAA